MEQPTLRPSLRINDGRGFYPKIKQKFNLNTAPEFSDYNPNSSTGATTSILIPQRGPITFERSPVNSHSDANSFSSRSIDAASRSQSDDPMECGIRYKKTLHSQSVEAVDSDVLGPFLISSFPLPRVNGMAVTNTNPHQRNAARNNKANEVPSSGQSSGPTFEV